MQMQGMDLRTQGGGRVSWDKVREWHGHIYNTKCKIASGKQPHSTGRSARCFVTAQRGGIGRVGGRCKRKRIYVYVQLSHFVKQQKLTHIQLIVVKQLYSNKDVKETKKMHQSPASPCPLLDIIKTTEENIRSLYLCCPMICQKHKSLTIYFVSMFFFN